MLALGAAAFGCSAATDDADRRVDVAINGAADPDITIVGGYETNTGYPAVGYLTRYSEGASTPFCTATLIAPNVVLAAAHCVEQEQNGANVAAGFGAISDASAESFGVVRIIRHPSYTSSASLSGTGNAERARFGNNDLALLVLDGSVRGISPLPLSRNRPAIGVRMRAVGYGRRVAWSTDGSDPASYYGTRKTAYVRTIDSNADIVGTRGENGQICHGDSGGPLLDVDGTAVSGVLSVFYEGSESCSASGDAMYANTADQADWIYARVAENLPRQFVPGSGIASTSWGPNRIDLFARAADRTLLHRWYSGSWSAWNSFGDLETRSDPSVVAWGNDRLDVFVRGMDDQLWHRWYDGASFSHWESLGGGLSSSPVAISLNAGHLDVFVRGSDMALWHRWYGAQGWSGWESLGGWLSTGPGAAAWHNGVSTEIDVFVGGGDRALYQRAWNPERGWHGYHAVSAPNTVFGDPSAVSINTGNINVFYKGSDASLRQSAWDRYATGGQWWNDINLGGTMGGDPSSLWMNLNGEGTLFVFTTDPSGAYPFAKGFTRYGWSGWTTF